MLLTNQRLDKLNAARTDFISRQMLPPDRLVPDVNNEDDDGGAIDERVLADVKLAWMKGTLYNPMFNQSHSNVFFISRAQVSFRSLVARSLYQ